MRVALTVLILTSATQAGAECGNLCDQNWWKTATNVHLQSELDAGVDVMARSESGRTSLHLAAQSGTPEHIRTLLDSGADVTAVNRRVKRGHVAV